MIVNLHPYAAYSTFAKQCGNVRYKNPTYLAAQLLVKIANCNTINDYAGINTMLQHKVLTDAWGSAYQTAVRQHAANYQQPNVLLRKIFFIRQNSVTLILKSADKGNAVVVMETKLYRQEARCQLSNEKYYAPLPGPLFCETAKKLAPILDTLRCTGFLTPKQHKHLTANLDEVSTRYFYMLPKVHKAYKSWPHQRMPQVGL